jgi:hypothetical protein
VSQATGYIPRSYVDHPPLSSPFMREWDGPLIPRAEWESRARDMAAQNLDALGQAIRFRATPTWQNGFGYCWFHAITMCMKCKYAASGQVAPRLSATAGAAKIKGYRDQGGNAFEATPFAAEHGVPTVDFWPENKVDRSLDTPEMQANAQRHRVLEWFELPEDSAEHLVTAILSGFAVWTGYAHIGHAMCGARYLDGKIWNINSWNKSASGATEWRDEWLHDKNTVYQIPVGKTCFEQYAIREITPY